MNLQDAYVEIADRSLDASKKMESETHFEMAAFQSYHAFESIGGALCEAQGVPYPKGHTKKLSTFNATARKIGMSHSVAKVAIIVGSIRNRCLYPFPNKKGGFETPKDSFSASNTKDMRKRVGGIVRAVKKSI